MRVYKKFTRCDLKEAKTKKPYFLRTIKKNFLTILHLAYIYYSTFSHDITENFIFSYLALFLVLWIRIR